MGERPRLPHFIIGGAPRAGTTFLCHVLERHPDIYIARPYSPERKVFVGRPRDAEGYRAVYAQLFSEAREDQVLGEKGSYYLENEQSCRLIKGILPRVRLIFLVREPAARAYSNYLWTRKNGFETLSFEEAIRLEGQRPSPLPPEQDYARPYDYLTRGHYDVFAERYYRAFGREQIRFYLYEELVGQPERVVPAIERFIGVTPKPLDEATVGFINSAREMGPPLDPRLEAEIKRRMKPSVERFRALTGLDVSVWGYDWI